jgi:hypothetical protein
MINIERKSLTRQSISEVTKELDQTRSRKRLTKAINETRNRESFPIAIRKEAILENLVSKLDAEEELRHILERRYRSTVCPMQTPSAQAVLALEALPQKTRWSAQSP